MKKRFLAMVALAVVLAGGGAWLALGGGEEAAPTGLLRPADTALVALGEKVYAAECAACHGANLEGEPNWQTRGADGLLPAPPHDASGHTWHHADEVLFNITKHGIERYAGPGYRSSMPAYEGILSDEEIVAVLSYIKSRWPKEVQAQHDLINQARQP